VPDAPAQLALFIARAVVDDVLPPAFVASAAVRALCFFALRCARTLGTLAFCFSRAYRLAR
jgi:hypothetical protein